VSALFVSLSALPAQQRRPPNVVMIISDDQAWTDFGFMGHPEIETPHLDALARRSVVFERGYVPSSLCRPSLATMITGLYPHEHGITGNDPPKGAERERMLRHIEAATTLPKLLAPLGYRSLQTGKWWEGNCRCGGFTDGMTHGDRERGGRHGDDGLKIGRQTMQPIYDFVEACGDEPFFLWYAPFLPHTPHNPPERLLKKYRRDGKSVHVAKYHAMCEWFDETCGQLLDHLRAKGLEQDTLVVFVTDNGWIQRPNARGYARRSKRSPYEGGVRTPILVSWPGRIEPGRREQLASSIDLAPTILRACGAEVPAAMSGRDLRDTGSDRGSVYGETFSHDVADLDRPTKGLQFRWMIRDGWKLIAPHAAGAKAELYHLADDPHERRDLAARHPERVAALQRALDAWWRLEPAGELRDLDGRWLYVEDRTEGRPVAERQPPMDVTFGLRVERDAVVLVRGKGASVREQRIPLDGSVAEAKGKTSVTRFSGGFENGGFGFDTDIVRVADESRIARIRREFRPTPEGLLVTVGDGVALYRHPEQIALPTPAKASIAELGWLQGAWTGTRRTSAIEERWSPPSGGAMLGVSRTVRKGRMTAFEFLRVVERDGSLVYIAQPGGRAATEFVLTELRAGHAVFANPRHDFPQRITYTLAADGTLTATIGFTNGGTPRQFVFPPN